MKVILYNVESSPLFRWFLVALMMNFKEKPGRSLHIISCHHHTRFSSTTATECLLFVCLVCKSCKEPKSPTQEDTQSYQSLQILQWQHGDTKYLHMKSLQAFLFFLKQLGVWGRGSLWVPEVYPFTIWQSQAEYKLPEAHKLPLACSPYGRVRPSMSWSS